jgi:glycosyltransferase involved in cell wall biosynthesis
MNDLTAPPLVSVVLTTYNGQAFLEEQLDSVFSQTYTNIELIAVDDGSTDDTIRILNRYAAARNNMKVYLNETNLGYIKNFEKGCKLSQGSLITLCDQDDHWHKEKIEKMVEARGDYPLIYCDSRLCDEELHDLGRNISDIVHNQDFDNCLQLAVMCRMYGHALLFTRSLFEKACPFLEVIPHDWWLAFTATLNGGVKYLPEPLVLYRQHGGNVFGVIGGKRKKEALTETVQAQEKQTAKNRHTAKPEHSGAAGIRNRIGIFYETCPAEKVKEKKVLGALVRSYASFSLANNFRRMGIFFSNYNRLLTVKKYSRFRKYFFCLKMFIKIK